MERSKTSDQNFVLKHRKSFMGYNYYENKTCSNSNTDEGVVSNSKRLNNRIGPFTSETVELPFSFIRDISDYYDDSSISQYSPHNM
jgi:hypothetical protein